MSTMPLRPTAQLAQKTACTRRRALAAVAAIALAGAGRTPATRAAAYPLVAYDDPQPVVSVRFWRSVTPASEVATNIDPLLAELASLPGFTLYTLAATSPDLLVSVMVTDGYVQNTHAAVVEERWLTDSGLVALDLDYAARGPALALHALPTAQSIISPTP